MLQAEHGDVWTEKFIDYYLGATHRNDSEHVCAMASLTPEVIHFDADMQEIYEEKMQHIANIIAGGLKGSIENNLSKAWVILSLLTGGVNIARSMRHEQSAEQVAASVKEYLRAIGC